MSWFGKLLARLSKRQDASTDEAAAQARLAKAEAVLAQSPDEPARVVALLNRARAYRSLKDYESALADYDAVISDLHLTDGQLWSIPITLDIPADMAAGLEAGSRLALRDNEGFMLAVLTVEDIWQPDKLREAQEVYGTTATNHPGVRYLLEQTHDTYVGGSIEGIQLPIQLDFETLRDTPEDLRHLFVKMGWQNVVGFHTCKPMHRLHRAITLQAAKEAQANILLHPSVGMTKPGDLHYYARVHCYQAIRRHYPHNMAMLSLLPSAVRMAGPREVLLNAIMRQNYGCSHMIVGPGHASPPRTNGDGERFYPRYAAQDMMAQYQDELDIRMVPIRRVMYSPEDERYLPEEQLDAEGREGLLFSDRDLVHHMEHGLEVPRWHSYPEVVEQLRHPLVRHLLADRRGNRSAHLQRHHIGQRAERHVLLHVDRVFQVLYDLPKEEPVGNRVQPFGECDEIAVSFTRIGPCKPFRVSLIRRSGLPVTQLVPARGGIPASGKPEPSAW